MITLMRVNENMNSRSSRINEENMDIDDNGQITGLF